MINYNYLLTIGIPVYNGAPFIEDTIRSIIADKGLNDEVEIIVSDNCSTDGTASIIKQYSEVKYFRNNQNIGYDRNVNNVFEKATGKFVWTIAADDIILKKGSIEEILVILKSVRELTLLHVGGASSLETDFQTYMGELFFLATNFQSGGVSTNIISREAWKLSKPSDFYGSGWVHYGVIIRIAASHVSAATRSMLVGENPATQTILKTWDSNGSSLKVMLELVKIFSLNMDSLRYSKDFKRKAKLLIKKGYPNSLIKSKANGFILNLETIKDFILCYKEFVSFWLIDLPVLMLPRSICRFIYSNRKIYNNV